MKTKGERPKLRLGKWDGQKDKFKNRFYEATSKTGSMANIPLLSSGRVFWKGQMLVHEHLRPPQGSHTHIPWPVGTAGAFPRGRQGSVQQSSPTTPPRGAGHDVEYRQLCAPATVQVPRLACPTTCHSGPAISPPMSLLLLWGSWTSAWESHTLLTGSVTNLRIPAAVGSFRHSRTDEAESFGESSPTPAVLCIPLPTWMTVITGFSPPVGTALFPQCLHPRSAQTFHKWAGPSSARYGKAGNKGTTERQQGHTGWRTEDRPHVSRAMEPRPTAHSSSSPRDHRIFSSVIWSDCGMTVERVLPQTAASPL